MTYSTKAPASTKAPLHPVPSNTFNPIKWLLDMDARYREASKLKRTEDHHLRDMGITRQEADTAFLRQFGSKR